MNASLLPGHRPLPPPVVHPKMVALPSCKALTPAWESSPCIVPCFPPVQHREKPSIRPFCLPIALGPPVSFHGLNSCLRNRAWTWTVSGIYKVFSSGPTENRKESLWAQQTSSRAAACSPSLPGSCKSHVPCLCPSPGPRALQKLQVISGVAWGSHLHFGAHFSLCLPF